MFSAAGLKSDSWMMVNPFLDSPKVFGLSPESVFTFIPESRSASSRNAVHLDLGITFTLPRNTHPKSPAIPSGERRFHDTPSVAQRGAACN
jgi:hypothetical protein